MKRLPVWLRRKLPSESSDLTNHTISRLHLNTVCESALCPNRSECFARRTATFMILGEICTRRCGFCAISVGRPEVLDPTEPKRVAEAALKMNLQHVVVTSVARDDLKDEGADAFYQTILAIRKLLPQSTIEVLTPDFHAKPEFIHHVCDAKPDVFNHNVETVERLSPAVRPQAKYWRSLDVLMKIKKYNSTITTKSGIMLGLGETFEEVISTLRDLRLVGCDVLTIGQYLKPKEGKLEVCEYIQPEVFSKFAEEGKKLGFREIYSGPYVRSSYHAGEVYERSQIKMLEAV